MTAHLNDFPSDFPASMDIHVLIAEDDAFLADIMKRALAERGARVTVVHNGQEAIEALERETPALLLLDLLMPVVDGYGVLEHLRSARSGVPVVILSNLSDKMNEEKCQKMGIHGYFVKSDIDEDQLWPLVEQYVKKAHA
jgi:CheY-like chemotaxis protein